jgi:hypothetical protein
MSRAFCKEKSGGMSASRVRECECTRDELHNAHTHTHTHKCPIRALIEWTPTHICVRRAEVHSLDVQHGLPLLAEVLNDRYAVVCEVVPAIW